MFLLISLVKCWLRETQAGRSSITYRSSFFGSEPFMTAWLLMGNGLALTLPCWIPGLLDPGDLRLERMSMMSSLKDLARLASLPFFILSMMDDLHPAHFHLMWKISEKKNSHRPVLESDNDLIMWELEHLTVHTTISLLPASTVAKHRCYNKYTKTNGKNKRRF